FIQLPITSDYVSAKLFLSSINTGIVAKQGTAIGQAITTAIRSFSLQSENSRALIIISDGENHEDNPVEAAQLAASQGIKVYTVGIGSSQGSPISMKDGGLMRDKNGDVVVTRLDEAVLEQIADAGNGVYVRATPVNLGLSNIINEIRQFEKQELTSVIFEDFNEQFFYFLFVALVLLIAEMLTSQRKIIWSKQFDFLNKH
ncbi:MAG: VWA domain-containing protein, partial [Bacteroidales bacterium]